TSYFCFVQSPVDARDLHSFPTRRSSDLFRGCSESASDWQPPSQGSLGQFRPAGGHSCVPSLPPEPPGNNGLRPQSHCMPADAWRSEEHTSELQSRENLVCRLLLEKKKI